MLRVDLPLALPTIMAGIRLATVSTVGLVTVAAIVGQGGLGLLIRDGLERDFRTLVVVGSALAVLVAVTADLLISPARRLPWQSRRPGTPRGRPMSTEADATWTPVGPT